MAVKQIYTVYPFQLIIDHLFALAIICILLALAVKSYLPYRETAKLCQALGGSPFIEMKSDMMLFHAQHGKWPESNQEALRNGWAEKYDGNYPSDYLAKANIENGAIHFLLRENLKGKVFTIRPAVPADDPLGPVIWVCGKQRSPSVWTVQGTDKTNVEDRYIPKSWR